MQARFVTYSEISWNQRRQSANHSQRLRSAANALCFMWREPLPNQTRTKHGCKIVDVGFYRTKTQDKEDISPTSDILTVGRLIKALDWQSCGLK